MRSVPTIIAAGALAAVLSAPAQAQGNIEAKAQACNVCHGQNGVPIDPKTIPVIWGQQVYYMVKSLHDYKTGARDNPIMSAIAKGLQLEELRPMAAYFAAKPWPPKQASAPAPAPPKGIAQCQACHQPNFEGGLPAPRLAGQSYEYLVGAMQSFADDKRTNSQDMQTLMKMLTAEERDAIAKYLSAL